MCRMIETTRTQAQQDCTAEENALKERFVVADTLLREQLAAAALLAAKAEAERRQLEEQLARVLSSEFWRMTAPLRLSIQLSRRFISRNVYRARIILRALKPANAEHRWELVQTLRRRVTAVTRRQKRSNNAVNRAPHYGIARARVPKSLRHLRPHQAAVVSYPTWSLRFDTPSVADLRHLEETAVNLPEVFVVARFTNEALHLIGRTVDALKATVGAQWSAVFITDNSEDAAFRNACANAFQDDKRFLTQPSREKLEGRIILLLEAGAIPRSHGIRLMAAPMVCNPDLALIYSDEDRISRAGLPELPWFKPEYSPLLAAQGMLFGRMLALRADSTCSRSTADAILDPSRSVLQIAIELTRELPSKRIGHVAHVLFHDVVPPMHPQPLPIPPLETLPVVSIFIPTRDHWHLLGPMS